MARTEKMGKVLAITLSDSGRGASVHTSKTSNFPTNTMITAKQVINRTVLAEAVSRLLLWLVEPIWTGLLGLRQAPISISHPSADCAKALKRIALSLDERVEEEEKHVGIAKLFSSVIRMRFMK